MDQPNRPEARAPERAAARIAPPPQQPGVWSGLGIVAAYLALQFVLSIVIGAAIGFAFALEAGFEAGLRHHKADVAALMVSLQANPNVRAALAFVTVALAAIAMALLVRWLWPAQWARADLPGFGLVRPADRRAYVAAVALGLGVLLLGGLLTHVLAGHHAVQQDIAVLGDRASPALRVLLVLLVVAIAPFVEELVFRGVLLSGLARRMPVGWAIVASALVFGTVHLPDFKFAWYPVPTLVLLGLALAWIRVRSHSLWPAIVLHATNNFVAALGWFVVAGH